MQQTIEQAFDAAALAFGGVDIIVNNAGISISKSIADHTSKIGINCMIYWLKVSFLFRRLGLRLCENRKSVAIS